MKLVDFLKELLGIETKKKPRKRTKKRATKKTKKKVSKKSPKKKATKKVKKKPPKKKVVKKPKAKKIYRPTPKPTKTIPEKEIGVITHYFGKISVGIIKLKTTLRVGDKIHIKGAHDDFTQVVKSMQLNHKDIATGQKGDEIGIKVPQPVHENDKVYKVA